MIDATAAHRCEGIIDVAREMTECAQGWYKYKPFDAVMLHDLRQVRNNLGAAIAICADRNAPSLTGPSDIAAMRNYEEILGGLIEAAEADTREVSGSGTVPGP